MPKLDASQDYTLLDASESGSYTQLVFERPRDTKDESDFAFMVSNKGIKRQGTPLQNVFVVTNCAANRES